MQVLRDLLDSKKFVTALIAVAVEVALKLGVPELTVAELTTIISPFLAYIGFQGFADSQERKGQGAIAQQVAAQERAIAAQQSAKNGGAS